MNGEYPMNVCIIPRWIAAAWVMATILLPVAARGAVLYTAPKGLTHLLEEAYRSNDGLKEIEKEIQALEQEVPAASSLEDPRLTLGVNALPTDSWSFSQEPMTQKQIFIAQKFPWFGELDLKAQKVVLAAARKREILRGRQYELRRSVSEAYFDLAFVQASLATNAELNQMVGQILQIAEASYASGRGLQQDVFQAQVELGELIDEQATLQSRKRQLEDRLNELVNREMFAGIEAEMDSDRFPEIDLSQELLVNRALQFNPALAALQFSVDSAQVDIELAETDYWPDVDVRVGYGQRTEDRLGNTLSDFAYGSVTLNLPIWFQTKQDRRLQAAQIRREAAESAYEDFRKRLPHKVDAILSDIRAIQDNYRLFREALLIQTDHWSRASLSAYEVGKVDFDTMINAHLRRIRFELQAVRYRMSMYQALARLEELTAADLRPMVQSPNAGEGGSEWSAASTIDPERTAGWQSGETEGN
jgi:outer membrane protein TolC